MKILCAEDNASLRGMINAMLAHTDVCVDFAADGVEAVSACETNAYDAILMDVDMPRLSGLQAALRIRTMEENQHLRHTPVVFLTGAENETEIDAGLTPGDGHIVKPFTASTLIQALGFATSAHLGEAHAAQ